MKRLVVSQIVDRRLTKEVSMGDFVRLLKKVVAAAP
jgi:hypothetical protein